MCPNPICSQKQAKNVVVNEELSVQKIIFDRLYDKYGPLIAVEKAWPLLGFNSRDSFNRATQKQRIPIHVIRPDGRRKSFVATHELSAYFATLTQSVRGEMPT